MDDNVLLIGAATGYCAALLSAMVASVVAVEEDEALLSRARAVLAGYGNVTLFAGPLAQGSRQFAPYSLILIAGAVGEIHSAIIDQLRDAGRLTTAKIGKGAGRERVCQSGSVSVVEES